MGWYTEGRGWEFHACVPDNAWILSVGADDDEDAVTSFQVITNEMVVVYQ